MLDFSKRSYQKELLDRNDIPIEDIKKNMQELEFINKNLGGHSATLSGFKKLLKTKKEISVCEIGCGGADNLRTIEKWCIKNKIKARFTGIDYNSNCISYAREKNPGYEFINSDYQISFSEKPVIIFSSLFCHHFTDEELIGMLKWMRLNSKAGFFINDLHRHPLAFYFIKLLTGLFSRSYLVKNDAPLSVLRGFKKKEWKDLLQKAGIENYSISWKLGFRFLIVSPLSPEGGT